MRCSAGLAALAVVLSAVQGAAGLLRGGPSTADHLAAEARVRETTAAYEAASKLVAEQKVRVEEARKRSQDLNEMIRQLEADAPKLGPPPHKSLAAAPGGMRFAVVLAAAAVLGVALP